MQLVIDQVSKRYSDHLWGLRTFSLTLETGVAALLGPNGAGKSTLMRILATTTQPTSGKITWDGVDVVRSPDALRANLGYLPQDFGIYPHLNAIEFLEYLAALKGLSAKVARQRISELLLILNLHAVCKRPLGSYSGGMKQRVGIAQALLNDPLVLIIDEPTAGLDPEERVRFRNLLSSLAGERIVLLSTHIVSDAEAAAARIAVIDQGSLIQSTTPAMLLQSMANKVWEWTLPESALNQVQQQYRISHLIRRDGKLQVRVIASQAPDSRAIRVSPTLEDAYLDLLAAHKNISSEGRE